MKLELPKIGLRNIKTAISVCLCILIFPKDPFFAAIAAVMCTQGSVESSVKSGINRLSGTLLGGVIGISLLFITREFHLIKLTSLITGAGIVIVIYICNLIKKPGACAISSIVLIAIMTAPETRDPFFYAIARTIETALGIIIALAVNKCIQPSDPNISD